MDRLYSNIGKRIKAWAKWIFITEAIASVIASIIYANENESFILFLIGAILGPIVALVSTWILYGFGELIDKTQQNEENTRLLITLTRQNLEINRKNASSPQPTVTTKAGDNFDFTIPAPTPQNVKEIKKTEAKEKAKRTVPPKNYKGTWICPNCHKKNMNRGECWFCKTYAPDPEE